MTIILGKLQISQMVKDKIFFGLNSPFSPYMRNKHPLVLVRGGVLLCAHVFRIVSKRRWGGGDGAVYKRKDLIMQRSYELKRCGYKKHRGFNEGGCGGQASSYFSIFGYRKACEFESWF